MHVQHVNLTLTPAYEPNFNLEDVEFTNEVADTDNMATMMVWFLHANILILVHFLILYEFSVFEFNQ